MKIKLVAALCLIVAVLLCGCSSGSDAGLNNSSPAASQENENKNSDLQATAAADDSFVLGKLVTVDENTGFLMRGLRLDGNLSDPEKNEKLPDIYGIRSGFVLDERISFFIDTDYRDEKSGNVKVFCLEHRAFSKYRNMKAKEMKEEAAFVERFRYYDEDLPNFTASVSGKKFSAGDYDILFTFKGKIVYYLVVNIAKVY